jgi:thiol-disulfide isomerase/thioredoxin
MKTSSLYLCVTLVLLMGMPVAAAPDSPGFLGLRIRAEDGGARIIAVSPDTGAETAGLNEGDLILQAGMVELGGLKTAQMTAELKGPLDSTLQVLVERFPGGGEPVEIRVVRGPRPKGMESHKPGYLSRPQREVNYVTSSLRNAKPRALGNVVQAWTHPEADPQDVNSALDRMLRSADLLAWTSDDANHASLEQFWTAAGSHEEFGAFVAGRDPETQLKAASVLARHAGSTPLAVSLLEGLAVQLEPALQELRAAVLRLAQAVAAGDAGGVFSLAEPGEDVFASNGWAAALGAGISDRAGVDLLRTDGLVERGSVPDEVARRIERSGLVVPWDSAPKNDATPLGTLSPPASPGFDLERLGGGTLNPDEHDGPLVLSFWATWCGPCKQEMPRLEELRAELADTGLEVWGLAVDEDLEDVPAFVEKQGWTMPIGLGDQQLMNRWGVGPIPRLFVLDAKGGVVLDKTGFNEMTFEKTSEEIRAFARGEMDLLPTFGHVVHGDGAAELVGKTSLDFEPTALSTDASGGLWIVHGNELHPVRFEGGELTVDHDTKLPLAVPGELVRWADLDGDGVEELITAKRGGPVLRVSHPDGSAIWTVRDPDPVGAFDVLRTAGGHRELVVLRTAYEQVPDPMGPLPNGQERPEVWKGHPRLDVHSAQGERVASVPLPEDVVQLVGSRDGDRLAVVLKGGGVHELSAGGVLSPVGLGARYARNGTWSDLDGDGREEFVAVGDNTWSVWRGRFGEQGTVATVVRVRGGDLVGIDGQDQERFKVDLQRSPGLSAITDLDRDGREELVLWAKWFGLAALQAGYEGHKVVAAPSTRMDRSSEDEGPAKRRKGRRGKRK